MTSESVTKSCQHLRLESKKYQPNPKPKGIEERKNKNTRAIVERPECDAIDIFINLPDTHNFINFSNKLDKEFWKTNQEYAIDTICILSKHTDDNLKTLLIKIRNPDYDK